MKNNGLSENGNIENEIQSLNRKSEKISATVSERFGSGIENPYVKTISYILSCQHEDGSWGSDDYPIWKPISTTQAIEALKLSGIDPDVEWEITSGGSTRIGSLSKAYEWLISTQQKNGGWGEDFWDSWQVYKTLAKGGHSLRSETMKKAAEFFRTTINSDWKYEKGKQWFGPAFLAAGIEMFPILRDERINKSLIDSLWKSQDPADGKFLGPKLSSGGFRVECEWHTAWVLLSISAAGIPLTSPNLAQAIDWLRYAQKEDGSWGSGLDWVRHIYTIAGVLAFNAIDGPNSVSAEKGVKWYLERQEPNGRIVDVGVTFTAAQAFATTRTQFLQGKIPFHITLELLDLLRKKRDLFEIVKNKLLSYSEIINTYNSRQNKLDVEIIHYQLSIDDLSRKLVEAETKIKEDEHIINLLQTKIKSYWFRLDEKQISIIGFIVGIVGLILACITFIPLDWFLKLFTQ